RYDTNVPSRDVFGTAGWQASRRRHVRQGRKNAEKTHPKGTTQGTTRTGTKRFGSRSTFVSKH
ncbi:MAG: hypothetical protein AB1Z50_12435, partial [Desulfuromonadales bacterium]